jgi:cytochrome b561
MSLELFQDALRWLIIFIFYFAFLVIVVMVFIELFKKLKECKK